MSDLIDRQYAIELLELAKDKDAKGEIGSFYNQIIQNSINIISDMPPAHPQWIPVSERLPEEGTEVLGTDDHGCIRHVVKDKCRLYEFATYEEMMHINIVAWQPLPEPYEG